MSHQKVPCDFRERHKRFQAVNKKVQYCMAPDSFSSCVDHFGFLSTFGLSVFARRSLLHRINILTPCLPSSIAARASRKARMLVDRQNAKAAAKKLITINGPKACQRQKKKDLFRQYELLVEKEENTKNIWLVGPYHQDLNQ